MKGSAKTDGHAGLIEDKKVPAELGAGHIFETAVEGDENAIIPDGQAQKVRIRNLLMARDAGREGSGNIDPTFLVSDRPVAVTWMRSERLKGAYSSLYSNCA